MSQFDEEFGNQEIYYPYDSLPSSSVADKETPPPPVFHSWVSVEADNQPVYVCMFEGCHASVETEYQFKLHIENHLISMIDPVSNYLSCPILGCHFSTHSPSLLRSHITAHYHHATQQMQGIQYVLTRQDTAVSSLRQCGFPPSLQVESDGMDISCNWELCQQEFMDTNEFFNHIIIHVTYCEPDLRTNKFCCGWMECGKAFKERRELKKHASSHVHLKRCACPFCGKYMCALDKLGDHLKRRLPEEQRIHKCLRCDSAFADPTMLLRHMKRHLHHLKCTFCGAFFRTPSEIQRHIAHVHDNFKVMDFMCPEEGCGKRFFTQQQVDQHAKVHRAPTIECNQCGEKFRFSSQLIRHREQAHSTHGVSGNRYMCHICNELFPRGDKLTNHLKNSHSCEAPPEGFARFTYKKNGDGYFRLQTKKLLRSNIGS